MTKIGALINKIPKIFVAKKFSLSAKTVFQYFHRGIKMLELIGEIVWVETWTLFLGFLYCVDLLFGHKLNFQIILNLKMTYSIAMLPCYTFWNWAKSVWELTYLVKKILITRFGYCNLPYKRELITQNKAVINYLPRCSYHLLYTVLKL